MAKNDPKKTSKDQSYNLENNTEKKMENQNTNQRGGEEYTSITGGPGMPGGYSNNDNKAGFEKALEESNYETLVSATGGIGGVPEDAEQTRKEYKYEDLITKLKAEVPNIMDEGVLISKINKSNVEYNNVFEKTNAMVAVVAYTGGMFLNQLQSVRVSRKHRDWTRFVKKAIPTLAKTARENRMNIAALPGVENHFTLGVERLAEISREYNKLSEKDQELLGDDPIESIFSEHDVDMTLSIDENRNKIDAVLGHHKLAGQGVIVEPATLVKFLKAGHKITAADRKHMIAIAKEDENAPAMYLKDVIAAGGDRDDLLGDPTPDAEFVDKKIKNIDTQVVKLDGTLKKVFEDDNLKGKVDLDAIGELIEKLEKLRSTIRSHRS
jgi:hypothetical protein